MNEDPRSLFQEAGQKLTSKDYLTQADGADEAFDQWYRLAAGYVKGQVPQETITRGTLVALDVLLARHSPSFFTHGATEEYVLKKVLGNIRKIATLFASKPKLRPLATSDSQIISFFNEAVVPVLQEAGLRASQATQIQVEFLKTLGTIAELGNSLVAAEPAAVSQFPFTYDVNALSEFAVRTVFPDVVRTAAFDLFQQLAVADNERVAAVLAQAAVEPAALSFLWRIGGLGSAHVLELVRIRAQQPHNHELRRGVLHSLHSVYSERDAGFDVNDVEVFDSALTLLEICDMEKSSYKHVSDTPQDGFRSAERAHEFIESLSTLFGIRPDSERLLNLALKEPLTLESIVTVESSAAAFSADTWAMVLLPYLSTRIEKMQLAGVSGSQVEQEVVNTVRECARFFYDYRETDRKPTAELGRALLSVMLEAIRHGYCETERFVAFAGAVVTRHLADGSTNWLEEALSKRVCHDPKSSRSVSDILYWLIGISSSSEIVPVPSTEQQQGVLNALASTATVKSLQFQKQLITHFPSFTRDQEDVVLKSLRSVKAAVASLVTERQNGGKMDDEYLEAAGEFVRALAVKVQPMSAPLLFDVALRVMALHPPAAQETAYSDEAVCMIVRKIPPDQLPPLPAISECLQRAGVQTREALALLVPELCLEDTSAEVRIAALEAMGRRPDLDPTLSAKIISASEMAESVGYTAMTDVQKTELAWAGATALATVCVNAQTDDKVFGKAVSLLLDFAEVSATNDVSSKPSASIVAALDRVATESDANTVLRFIMKQRAFSRVLHRLGRYSSGWREYVAGLKRGGILAEEKGEYSLIGGDDPKSGGAVFVAQDLYNLSLQFANSGRFMEALRTAIQLKTMNQAFFDGVNGMDLLYKSILPGIGRQLPTPTRTASGNLVFSPIVLGNYDHYAQILSEVRSLCPYDGEAVLFISHRMSDLDRNVVQMHLENGQPSLARKFVQSHRIHSPMLQALIDKWEWEHMPQVEAPRGSAITWPEASAPPAMQTSGYQVEAQFQSAPMQAQLMPALRMAATVSVAPATVAATLSMTPSAPTPSPAPADVILAPVSKLASPQPKHLVGSHAVGGQRFALLPEMKPLRKARLDPETPQVDVYQVTAKAPEVAAAPVSASGRKAAPSRELAPAEPIPEKPVAVTPKKKTPEPSEAVEEEESEEERESEEEDSENDEEEWERIRGLQLAT